MLYAITIDHERFDLGAPGAGDRVFAWCEERFGFSGAGWDEEKADYDYERLAERLALLGVPYEEHVE